MDGYFPLEECYLIQRKRLKTPIACGAEIRGFLGQIKRYKKAIADKSLRAFVGFNVVMSVGGEKNLLEEICFFEHMIANAEKIIKQLQQERFLIRVAKTQKMIGTP